MKCKRNNTEWGAEWFAPTTLRALVDAGGMTTRELQTFGCDESERTELMDEVGLVRIIAAVDSEIDDNNQWDSEPRYDIEVYEARPATSNTFEPEFYPLAVNVEHGVGNNPEAALSATNRARREAARKRSDALKPLFNQIVGSDTIADIENLRVECDSWNAELIADSSSA